MQGFFVLIFLFLFFFILHFSFLPACSKKNNGQTNKQDYYSRDISFNTFKNPPWCLLYHAIKTLFLGCFCFFFLHSLVYVAAGL